MQRRVRIAISLLAMSLAGALTWVILNARLSGCQTSNDRFQPLNCLAPGVEPWWVVLAGVVAATVTWVIIGKVRPRK